MVFEILINTKNAIHISRGQVFSVASGKSEEEKKTFLKKYERKTDSKLNSYIDFLWFLTATEKNKPKQVKYLFLATLRLLCPPDFFLPPILILRDD